jgi:NADH:ubiquinone oxidoreductase subunit 2 (subunit N)
METLAFSIAVLALGGLPLMAGFVSKWQIFVAGMVTMNTWMIVIVVLLALNSVLSLGYYAPLVNAMYRKDAGEVAEAGKSPDAMMQVALVVLAAFIIVIGLYPPAIEWVSKLAGQVMFLELGLGS